MPKARAKKEASLVQLTDALKSAKSVVFTGFAGLTVKQTTELRKELKKEGVALIVAKRTLFQKALKDLNLPEPDGEIYDNGVQVAFGVHDEVAPARVLSAFAKKAEHLKIRGGMLEGALLSKQQVVALAALPTKDQLRGQLVGVIAAPLRGLASVLQAPIRGLVTVLAKKAEQTS